MQGGPTDFAEVFRNVVRRPEGRQAFLPGNQPELGNTYGCPCAKGGTVPPPAFRTMAVVYGPQLTGNFVLHILAKTLSSNVTHYSASVTEFLGWPARRLPASGSKLMLAGHVMSRKLSTKDLAKRRAKAGPVEGRQGRNALERLVRYH